MKSGKAGKLKSLHLFMDASPSDVAIRFYAGSFSVNTVKTLAGKEFKLLNLPYFLVSQTERYLDWIYQQ